MLFGTVTAIEKLVDAPVPKSPNVCFWVNTTWLLVLNTTTQMFGAA